MPLDKPIKRVFVDRSLCIASADCIAIAPEVFELDHEGIAVVKDPKGVNDDTLFEAAVSCPTKAIFLWDESGKQIWPPPEEGDSRPMPEEQQATGTTA